MREKMKWYIERDRHGNITQQGLVTANDLRRWFENFRTGRVLESFHPQWIERIWDPSLIDHENDAFLAYCTFINRFTAHTASVEDQASKLFTVAR